MTGAREWTASMRCSRCLHVIRVCAVDVSEAGEFEISGLPSRCSNPECQAGFSSRTPWTLVLVLHRGQAPGHDR